jgi:uncharacterized protein (TIGR03083 family)
MDAYVAEHEEAAAEAERLRVVAAWLGAAGALHPPLSLRDRLLASTAPVAPLPPVDALRRESARFDALLATLAPDDLELPTENGLSVRDLVTHVAIVDEAFVAGAGATAFIDAAQVEAMTRAQLPETAAWSFEQVCDRYRRARAALIGLDSQLAVDAKVGGYSLSSALVIRAFETWTHCRDIASAAARPEAPAEARVLRTMAELAVNTLPLALAARGYDYADRTARVVMTGPGGGDWTIACNGSDAPGSVPDVVLRVPVIEFCRRFADRLTVDEVPFDVEGDVELGRALVDAAPAFAGL